jgi:hypothetical protein
MNRFKYYEIRREERKRILTVRFTWLLCEMQEMQGEKNKCSKTKQILTERKNI